jgi:hypothetical protein
MATRTRSPSGYPDTTSINLNRLLSRLERIVLVEPTPQLRKSSYERARVSAVSTSDFRSVVAPQNGLQLRLRIYPFWAIILTLSIER